MTAVGRQQQADGKQAEAVVMILGLASGDIAEEGLARWIGDNWPAGARRGFT